MIRRLARVCRVNAITVQLASVFVGTIAVIVIGLTTNFMLRDQAAISDNHSRAALLAVRIDARVGDAEQVFLDGRSTPNASLENIQLSPAAILRAHSLLDEAVDDAREMHRLIGSETTLQILGAVMDLQGGLDLYASGSHIRTLEELQSYARAVSDLTARAGGLLTGQAKADHDGMDAVVHLSWLALLIAVGVTVVLVGGTSWVVGMRLNHAMASVRQENVSLARTTAAVQRRNEQFQALYQVMTEVTETLSLKYVVQTAIREAKRLVAADVAILRLLRGDMLDVAGVEADQESDVKRIGPLQLGAGLVGRAAKRGKTAILDERALESMLDREGMAGAQSGLVVPLIVGARVVGTLACWSRQKDHFTADDQQVLEMMASQVAIAVAAADVHEASEHDAHTDALTLLPNRRQLLRDTTDRFAAEIAAAVPVSVAMVDIDHFKRFNDEFGHRTGDITLQRVAETLRSAIRETDRVYRYGGEEFTIVLFGVDADQARLRMEHVRAAVERSTLLGEDTQIVGPVTVSIGLASGPDQSRDFDELIKLADAALYQSKWAGRNRVTVYDPDIVSLPEREEALDAEAA